MSQTTHYRATFNVKPTQAGDNCWGSLIGTVRKWMSRGVTAPEVLPNGAFYTGLDWESRNKTSRIQTVQCVGSGTNRMPEFWAARWVHPCHDFPYDRKWQSDVAVSSLANGLFQFHIEIAHSIRPGFLGEFPTPPTPTTPSLVHWLLNGTLWSGVVGDWKLSSKPFALRPGGLNTLKHLLEDPSRQCPAVFVSRDTSTGNPRVDPDKLATFLAGNAFVMIASNEPDADNEMDITFDKTFRCFNGMVRVYQPKVSFKSETDSRRHRFYTGDDIERLGSEMVEEQLVTGLVRQPLILRRPAIASIDDVDGKLRTERIAVLTAQTTDGKWQEWLKEYQAEMDRNKELATKVESLEYSLVEKDDVVADKEDENARLRFECEQSRKLLGEVKAAIMVLQDRDKVLASLNTLPESLIDVVESLEKIHGNRIAFTERAKRSARGYDGVDVGTAWACLWNIATILHGLYFGDSKGKVDISAEFDRLSSGFTLALSEGAATRKDNKLMKLRKDTYKGIQIDIEPHVGYGNKKGKMLRVHYSVLKDKQLLVIGHCGDHLDNYTSQFIH